MNTGWIVFIIIAVILTAAIVALYFMGKRTQKNQEAQEAQIEATKQPVTMLIIDKKRMKAKDSGLPAQVLAQMPRLAKMLTKIPVVKAKVGPQVVTLICNEKCFDDLPVKKEVKAMVSGIYIVSFKGLRGAAKAPAKPKSKFRKFVERMQEKAGAKPVK